MARNLADLALFLDTMAGFFPFCTRASIRCTPQPLMPDLFTAASVPEAPPNEGIAPGAVQPGSGWPLSKRRQGQ